MGVNYTNMVGLLVNSIQEQQTEIDSLNILSPVEISSLSSSVLTNETAIATLKNQLELLQTQVDTQATLLNLKDLEVTGGAVFKGTATFEGPAIFKALAEFIDKTVFRQTVEFEKTAYFKDGMEIKDRATGDIYCWYTENGDMKKMKGRCSELSTDTETTTLEENVLGASTEPATSPVVVSPTPTPTPTPSTTPTDVILETTASATPVAN